jgi:hypothetical protein
METTLLMALLGMGGLSSFRQDDNVSRQGVMNHQTSAHLMDLSFIRDATEMSIPESYAVQGLAMSTLPAQAAGMNLSSITPPGLKISPG